MRARHRHFNPRFAGAELVLDARYINQSDNTEISQWDDRSGNGNHATQSVSANRATFQTGECGGNGIVSFDGTNDDFTLTSNVTSVETFVFTGKERQQAPEDANHVTVQYVCGASGVGIYTSAAALVTFAGGASIGMFDGSTLRSANFGSGNIRSYGVVCANRSNHFINSKELTYGFTGTPNAITISRIGSRAGFAPCYIDLGSLFLFKSSLSSSLRRRIEHASAFSWKISCN